jgi:hypothetical protein
MNHFFFFQFWDINNLENSSSHQKKFENVIYSRGKRLSDKKTKIVPPKKRKTTTAQKLN